MHVELTYDRDGDVLYASIGRPAPCTSRDIGHGVLVRHDVMTGDITAVSLMSAYETARNHREELAQKLTVVPRQLRDAIAAWIERVLP